MTPRLHLAFLILLCSSHLISSIRRPTDNDSPLAAYLVTVRRPDGLLAADEPEAMEQWHTFLLGQVCNTSDPATKERFPTAESRLIFSYSHVVSGFSAWLTAPEVDHMTRLPWFIEAVPDKSYKLMSVDDEMPTPEIPWLESVRDGVWSKGNMGEGITIGVLDAGIAADHLPVSPDDAQDMPSPSAKWKGGCDHSETCNNKLIGLRTFVDTSRALGAAMFIGEVGPTAAQPTSDKAGNFTQLAEVLGVEYDRAFEVAPKAHLAIYRVCNDECHPAAVNAGMAAAVDDGVDVISISVVEPTKDNNNTAVFHDDAVTAPSYKAVARGVPVCAPAGSIGPDMLKLESNAPWLLTVSASDVDRRVVTNVELGNGILKPDVSAPGAYTLGDVVDHTDGEIKAATSMAAAHVSGVAALIKKAHHEWSPAAIKSALVTTADQAGPGDALPGSGKATSYFVTGAGEVNPVRAMDPGLVYDHDASDFIPYLCGMRLGADKIVETAQTSCAEAGEIAGKDLNYPSIMIAMEDEVQQVEAKRTVTNVGEPVEEYRVEVTAEGVEVAVSPSTLVFGNVGQKREFVVTVRRQASTPAKTVIEGELRWVSGKHAVRSPLVVVVGETAASSAGLSSYGADVVASINS